MGFSSVGFSTSRTFSFQIDFGTYLQPSPYNSVAKADSDGKPTGEWTHTATNLSGEDADVKAVATAVWTDTVKANYKAYRETQDS